MSADSVSSAFRDEVQHRALEQARSQRDELLRRATELQAFVRSVPGLLASARLDEAQGKPTRFDYDRHAALLRTL
jgi:hypothetical protein